MPSRPSILPRPSLSPPNPPVEGDAEHGFPWASWRDITKVAVDVLKEYKLVRSKEDSAWLFCGDGSPSVQVPKFPDPLPPEMVRRVALNLERIKLGVFYAELRKVVGETTEQ